MTKAQFLALPWLVFEKRVTEVTGYAPSTLGEMVDRGVLVRVKPKGCGQGRYQKVQLAQLLGLPAAELGTAQWKREPLLMSEKSVLGWTGYSEDVLHAIVKAGGLVPVQPAGNGWRKYRKGDVGMLIGLTT